MRLEGRVWKRSGGRYWLVEVPILDVATQGKTKKDAYEMIADAVEALAGRESFSVVVTPGRGGSFTLQASVLGPLVALILKRQRLKYGLTVREVSARMHAHSPNAYAQYEQGRVAPTLETLDRLLAAIAPNCAPVLKIA